MYETMENTQVEVYEDNAGSLRLYVVDRDAWEPVAGWMYQATDEEIAYCAADFDALVNLGMNPWEEGWEMDDDMDDVRRWYNDDCNMSTRIACSEWEHVVDCMGAGASGEEFARLAGDI